MAELGRLDIPAARKENQVGHGKEKNSKEPWECQRKDGRTDGRKDGRTDGQMDRRKDDRRGDSHCRRRRLHLRKQPDQKLRRQRTQRGRGQMRTLTDPGHTERTKAEQM